MTSYFSPRNAGCRVTEVQLRGLTTLFLENDVVRVGVLVDKGTDIFQFVHKPTDTDFMVQSPTGIRDPRVFVPTRPSATQGAFLDYWEGGWPEMFPNAGYICTYKGADLGLHGDVSLMPWDWQVVADTADTVSVAFSVRAYRLPLRLEKSLTLRRGSGALVVRERVTNEGGETVDFSWGHHPTLGGEFLSADCVLDVPAAELVLPDWQVDPASRLVRGGTGRWPHAPGVDGSTVDLSRVAPAATGSHDLAFLRGFTEGWYALTNQARGVGFGMRWDPGVFKWLWFWQVWGGGTGWPWFRSWYCCGIEPSSSFPPSGLTDQIARGDQLTLEPGAALETELLAVAYAGSERVSRIAPDGKVERRAVSDPSAAS